MKPIKFQILVLIIMIWKLKKKTYVLFKKFVTDLQESR